MALATLVAGASVLFWSGTGRAAEGARIARAVPHPEIAPCLYGQTVFYEGLADERGLVKGKLEKVKTGADRWEANAFDGLLKQKEAVLFDLTAHLAQMTGKAFSETNVLPATGIVLARADSRVVPTELARRLEGKGLEAFLIHSEKTDRLWIVANDMRGLSHGVYYYLEQLGVRWLMAGKNWTVVPRRQNLAMDIDRLVEPSFISRSLAPSGGFYGNLWGGKFKGSAKNKEEWDAWVRRMRTGGIGLGKAMGEAFVAENREALAQHPEYLAKIDGKFTPLFKATTDPRLANYVWNEASNRFVKAAQLGTGTHQLNEIAKLNAGNPAAVALFSDWILKQLRAKKAGPQGYAVRTQSVEPSDGHGEGNNYDELKAQGVGDGSESDQEFFIANACARKIRQAYPEVSVIMCAYAGRSDPPSFPLEPNFIVQPCPWRDGRKTARLSEDEWLAAWKAKTDPTPMAFYDFWSICDWTRDQPEFNYLELAKKLRRFYAYNIKAVNAETTYGGGAMGIGQYLSMHLMWDINLDEKALIEDWYDNAFGPAKAPMKRMMERWARHYRPISIELAYSYRDIDEAERLAAGNAAVLARVDDYARYLHYLRLWSEYLWAPDIDHMRRVIDHLLDIDDSLMAQTFRILDFYTLKQKSYPPLKEEFRLAGNPKETDGPGWARIHTLSHEEVAALMQDGMARYPMPDFAERRYGGKLVPLKPIQWKLPGGDPWGVDVPMARGDMDLLLPEGVKEFPVRLSKIVGCRLTIADDSGKTVFDRFIEAAAGEDYSHWSMEELRIALSPGHYRVMVDGGKLGVIHFQTWKGMPLVWRGFWNQKFIPSPRLYFYVPHGLSKVAFYFPVGVGAGGREPPFYLPNGERAKVEVSDGGKLAVIAVPAGMDGKVWALERLVQFYTSFEPLTIPAAFALDPDVLMVPSDAL